MTGGTASSASTGTARPSLNDMPWSTDEVLDRTVERASASGLVVKLLPLLTDIDEPSDLPFWTPGFAASPCPSSSRRSMRNAILPRTLETLEPDTDVEDHRRRRRKPGRHRRALAEQAGAKIVIVPGRAEPAR